MSVPFLERFLEEPSSLYFVRVPDGFISEFLGKSGLEEHFSLFDEARSLLLENNEAPEEVERQAKLLYMLVHAEYLKTDEGVDMMYRKRSCLMTCPRVFCKDTWCWPCQSSVNVGEGTIKMFCPTCKQIYNPENKVFDGVDSVGFPSQYIDSLVEKYPEIVLNEEQVEYVPRIYGFKVFNSNSTEDTNPEGEAE